MRLERLALVVLAVACGGKGARVEAPPPPAKPEPPPAAPLVVERLDRAETGEAAPILSLIEGERRRAMEELSRQPESPPYFLAYRVTDRRSVQVAATRGALLESSDHRRRHLDVDLRVGDHRLDNTHRVRGIERYFDRLSGRGEALPLADDPVAVRTALWRATDRAYRNAVERLTKVKANLSVRVEEEDKSADLSREEPSVHLEPPRSLEVDREAWEARMRRLSLPFREHPHVDGRIELEVTLEHRYLTTTEETRVQTSRLHARLSILAARTASDGMELSVYESLDATAPDRLPSDGDVERVVRKLIAQVDALADAPLAEPYVGPAILEGHAAGVFFHEIFGHRVEGHRQKDEEEGQTFAKKIGERVMPAFLDVYDDPTVARAAGVDVNGAYSHDDEGVPAQRASLVDDGVLRGFLLSRSVARGFERSNGHGRGEPGRKPVARQANLIVEPSQSVTAAGLKERLLDEVRRQNKPYGLRFQLVQGGFTNTSRYGPQAFKVLPVLVYRVHLDGREELIRGADIEGTPLASLETILAAGDDYAVFNGFCGAESGWVPVSAVSPSLLVGTIEIARKTKAQDKPPVLPPPELGGAEGDALDSALRDELARATRDLALPDAARPYYLAYRVTDVDSASSRASLGATLSSTSARGRSLGVVVRVGDHKLDNGNFVDLSGWERGWDRSQLPIDDDYHTLRYGLWRATDDAYKTAVEQLEKKRAARAKQTADPDAPASFSDEPPAQTVSNVDAPAPDLAAAEALARDLSAVLRDFPELHDGEVAVAVSRTRRRFRAGDGTIALETRPLAQVRISMSTQAEDGMRLRHGRTFAAPTLAALPAGTLEAETRQMARDLVALRGAPRLEDYTGPILFEGRAGAEVVELALAQELQGTPPPEGTERFSGFGGGKESSLGGKIGQKVLPAGFTVIDDPTATAVGSQPLAGGYLADDEGVPAQRVVLVKDGKLETLLMSRTPRKRIDRSNGHGRATAGDDARARVANLIVSTTKGVAEAQLRKKLIDAARKAGLDHAYVVRSLDAFDLADAMDDPGAFMSMMGDDDPKLTARVVERIGKDGKTTLVRGAVLSGVSPASFRKIVAAGRDAHVIHAAERMAFGGLEMPLFGSPASVAAPSLLFEEAELRRSTAKTPKPPALSRP